MELGRNGKSGSGKRMSDPKELYIAGYGAFDKGDFPEAARLATQCLASAPSDSYWHFGALGLRCWATNYLGDITSVEKDAHTLLAEDSGTDKAWFDGLALFNLGLAYRQTGKTAKAREFFAQASERYTAHCIDSEQPSEWILVSEFFAVVTYWAAFGKTDRLDILAEKLTSLSGLNEETQHLNQSVALYQRLAKGEDVRQEAITLKGVSKAFLALIFVGQQMSAPNTPSVDSELVEKAKKRT